MALMLSASYFAAAAAALTADWPCCSWVMDPCCIASLICTAARAYAWADTFICSCATSCPVASALDCIVDSAAVVLATAPSSSAIWLLFAAICCANSELLLCSAAIVLVRVETEAITSSPFSSTRPCGGVVSSRSSPLVPICGLLGAWARADSSTSAESKAMAPRRILR